MYILIALLAVAFSTTFGMGYKRLLRLQHLNQKRIINSFILVMVALTLVTIGQGLGWVSEQLAARFTMFLYVGVAGFFAGFAVKMILLRQQAEAVEYIYRSFWTEAAPTFIAILLIAFGLYRTGLFSGGAYTGIGITTGLSLLGFGLLGLTMRIVPEFRQKGILILDQFVPWNRVVSYEWESETVIQIDYYTSDKNLTDFNTYIPADDRLIIEQLLGKKLKEHEQERKKTMDLQGDKNS